MTTILVFEPEASGHQMGHLRSVLTGIAADHPEWRVILLTTEAAAGHPNCRRVAADFAAMLTVRVADEVPASRVLAAVGPYYAAQKRHGDMVHRAIRAIGPGNLDFVLLLQAEAIGLWQMAARRDLCCGLPWATVSVGIRFHHPAVGIAQAFKASDVVQRWLFYRVLAHPGLACFASVNPTLGRVVRYGRLAYCPVPAFAPAAGPAAAARAFYGVRPGSFVVLAYGFLTRRKCIDLLIEAALRVDPAIDVTVLLAGRQHSNLAPVMQGEAARRLREAGRLVEANRFIMDGKDLEPLGAADVSWVYYQPHFVHASGVLVRSGQAGVPAIGRRLGLIGWLLEETGSGVAVGSDDAGAIARALEDLARDPAGRAAMGARGRAAFAGHTPEAYARPLVEAMARSVGG